MGPTARSLRRCGKRNLPACLLFPVAAGPVASLVVWWANWEGSRLRHLAGAEATSPAGSWLPESPRRTFASSARRGPRRRHQWGRGCPDPLVGRSLSPSWASLTPRKLRSAIHGSAGFLGRLGDTGIPDLRSRFPRCWRGRAFAVSVLIGVIGWLFSWPLQAFGAETCGRRLAACGMRSLRLIARARPCVRPDSGRLQACPHRPTRLPSPPAIPTLSQAHGTQRSRRLAPPRPSPHRHAARRSLAPRAFRVSPTSTPIRADSVATPRRPHVIGRPEGGRPGGGPASSPGPWMAR